MHSSSLLTLAATLAAASAQSLTDVLADQSDTLSLFTQLVQQANLVDTLNGLDSATIFAPTNDALNAALQQFPDLVSDDDDDDDDDSNNNNNSSNSSIDLDSVQLSQRFIDILQYHVIPGSSLLAEDVPVFPGAFEATYLNDYVVNPYQTEDGGVMVYSRGKRMSEVAAANIEYDNGVIHTLDSVLLPPDGVNDTLLDLGLTYLYGALQETDLTTDVATADGITVFVPTNQAFIDVGQQLQDLSAQDLSTILQFHVVPSVAYTTDLADGDTLDTLANTEYNSQIDIHVDENDGALYASNARVITANILLSNGVAHLIDEVLNPNEDAEDYYGYELGDDGNGVPAFEDAASATIPALTSGVTATGSYEPTSTFSAVSGAEAAHGKYQAEILGGALAAGALGIIMA